MIPARQLIQGLFQEAIVEIGASPPPNVPKGYSIPHFYDNDALAGLLSGAEINQVTVDEHHTTVTGPNIDTLWHGGWQFRCDGFGHQDKSTR